MISKLSINKVSSYKRLTVLETDKPVNLIYGLNGTGKSTISNYFKDPEHSFHSSCSHEGGENTEFIVYNQRFIEDVFYQSSDLPGIFTLSKKNKEAQTAIDQALNELKKLETTLGEKREILADSLRTASKALKDAKESVWEIKKKYSGGDRILDFCLEGYKGNADKLFDGLRSIPCPEQRPARTIAEIEADLKTITSDDAVRQDSLQKLIFDGHAIEADQLFSEPIVGSSDSSVATLVNKLGSSDWVRQGLSFIPEASPKKDSICPFCQETTISEEFIEKLRDYFDEAFEKETSRLASYSSDYIESTQELHPLTTYSSHPGLADDAEIFTANFNELIKVFDNNRQLIKEKLANPSKTILLTDTAKRISTLNKTIDAANERVKIHNQKIDDLSTFKQKCKEEFWTIMRWDYDHIFTRYETDSLSIDKHESSEQKAIQKLKDEIDLKRRFIAEQQKSTVNIDEAVVQINATLAELGMHDFSIAKKTGGGDLYQIVRQGQEDGVFSTLSEGEKMMISFIYFVELCRGKTSATAIPREKVVVIDDPISSLSHIFVFNVGRLIYREFMKGKKYAQVFVLTHNLYFFHELADMNKERRERDQKLFRIIKNSDGSQIVPMRFEEIQNDYHTYWAVINDEKQPGALVANCMRNVIEYFFGFVEKRDLNAVFTKPELSEIRFQAFHRYINRESHSLPQNIFDQKEFDYNDFKDALKLIFKLSGYEKHYQKMAQ